LSDLFGYRGASLLLLQKAGASIGDVIDLKTIDSSIKGSLIPRYEHSDDKHIVVKLDNGYNIGVKLESIQEIKIVSKCGSPTFKQPPLPKVDESLPVVAIVGTGGTIASRIDYRTGGVHPQFSAQDLYAVVPEIAKYAQIRTVPLFNVYSEHVNSSHWTKISEKIIEILPSGVDGVVVAHGTDTMAYTSAALSFALSGVGVPIVMVGSQRSTDRPSSDAALNLVGAVAAAAQLLYSGVFVAMHSSINDDEVAIHSGCRVRKNHTSRRDAFESIDVAPSAYVKEGKVKVMNKHLPVKDKQRRFESKCGFERNVALIKFHPNLKSSLIDYLVNSGYRGIIFEGTGLGHISDDCYSSIAKAVERGIVVGVSSQCIWGRVSLTVYDSGRDLLKCGVLPLGNMLSETALVKLMWVLGNTSSTDDAKRLMLENISGEYTLRSPLDRRPA